MSRLIIVPHRPLRTALQALLLIVLLGLSGYLVFLDDSGDAGWSAHRMLNSSSDLRRELGELEAANTELRRRLIAQERARQVEARAYAEVEERLVELQDQVLELREEVAFYEAIVAAPGNKRLNIQTLVLDRVGIENVWRYQLVLTRNTKSINELVGSVTLAVEGEQRGETWRLGLESISEENPGSLDFHFRYFQRLEGRLTLPPGFVPTRVLVQAIADGMDESPVERTFDWPGTGG